MAIFKVIQLKCDGMTEKSCIQVMAGYYSPPMYVDWSWLWVFFLLHIFNVSLSVSKMETEKIAIKMELFKIWRRYRIWIQRFFTLIFNVMPTCRSELQIILFMCFVWTRISVPHTFRAQPSIAVIYCANVLQFAITIRQDSIIDSDTKIYRVSLA